MKWYVVTRDESYDFVHAGAFTHWGAERMADRARRRYRHMERADRMGRDHLDRDVMVLRRGEVDWDHVWP